MVQALHEQDGTLSPGLTMQNTYTELRKGSKKAVVVVWNNTAYPQTLWKRTFVARAVSACYQCLNPLSPTVCKLKMTHVP